MLLNYEPIGIGETCIISMEPRSYSSLESRGVDIFLMAMIELFLPGFELHIFCKPEMLPSKIVLTVPEGVISFIRVIDISL